VIHPLIRWYAGFALLLCLGCGRPAPAPSAPDVPAWFEDVTTQVGLDFQHDAGPVGRYFMPQIMGAGVALLDFDNDGRLDIFLIQNGGPGSSPTHRLFRQTEQGTFEDVSSGSGLDVSGYGMGVAVGDFDNDGWIDVYISQYGGGRLFRNRGKATDGRWLGFEDVTSPAGVEQPCWGTSCCFADYDRDGWLDLVVVNYVDYDPSAACAHAGGQRDYCHPSRFPGTAARLFHNRGKAPDGRWRGFEDVTVKSGLAELPGPGLGVLCADFNEDGWPDIFVANDAKPNHLWINQKNGTFKEEAVVRGVACHVMGTPQANMGVTAGDVNGDGGFGLFITHLTEESHTLWLRTDSPGMFSDRTARYGLASTRWRGTGFGTILADFDHDGWLDLAVVNGRVSRGVLAGDSGLESFWGRYAERNQLFAGEKGRFRDISSASEPFCATPAVSRGLTWGVLDNNRGAVDLVVTAVGGPARVYRNVAPKAGRHWLVVRAVDPQLKRDAYGAAVRVHAGNRTWTGWVNPGQSYLSSGDPRVHFGLGPVDRVDHVDVTWLDGRREEFPAPAVDRVITLERGRGRKVGP
jgi:hypothetical protein